LGGQISIRQNPNHALHQAWWIISELLDRHRGESLRGFTMKEPRLNDLVINDKGTQQIRRKMASARSVKITINIDKDSLDILRAKAAETGMPYQRLLNQFLNRALQNDEQTESRLDRLEKEITRLKKIVA
jgi:predicted DNA binding CopG/RHH family protein